MNEFPNVSHRLVSEHPELGAAEDWAVYLVEDGPDATVTLTHSSGRTTTWLFAYQQSELRGNIGVLDTRILQELGNHAKDLLAA